MYFNIRNIRCQLNDNYCCFIYQVFEMSTFWLSGFGFGLSTCTITGILKALPYATQTPDLKVLSLVAKSLLTLGRSEDIKAKSSV